MELHSRGRILTFPRRPLVMGIVNLNDDSFCQDGTLDAAVSLEQARQQVAEGADVIDAGAESARTNRAAISVQEEVRRFATFLRLWNEWIGTLPAQPPENHPDQVWPPWLSLNTWRPETVAQVLPLGGDLLNDMGALPDDRNARLCAHAGIALLIMHSVGEPKTSGRHVRWPDIFAELEAFFQSRLDLCAATGLPEQCTLLDPGLDFAKPLEDNLTILREAHRLQQFGRPVLLPVSRKTVIGQVLRLKSPVDRDAGTLACIAQGMRARAQIFRVHAVAPAVAAVRTLHALGTLR